MILYVDYEHPSTYLRPRTEWLLAARARIAYMLQDVTGQRCLLQRYADVDAGIVDELDIAGVFISGNGADPALYDPADLDGLRSIVSSGRTPVFRHAHTQQLEDLPGGFVNLARSEVTELQYIAHASLRIAGTQFRPEYFTDEHPAGRRLIENYWAWSGVI